GGACVQRAYATRLRTRRRREGGQRAVRGVGPPKRTPRVAAACSFNQAPSRCAALCQSRSPRDLATLNIPTPFASGLRTLRLVALSIFGWPGLRALGGGALGRVC